ncbi:MAG: redox-sensing transcriptional repressor Rex [Eubacterium sp.]|nr:redox-sensing transcriptional repressor Rex [Eubacterium sp.]
MSTNNISSAVINRLPRYYRFLADLLREGVDRISSSKLSQRMGVTASQIRQDLNNFGGFGLQGYGYNVKFLHEAIGKILGLDTAHNMIIIGAGNLGRALANYADFENLGFFIISLFDSNPELEGTSVRGIPVRRMEGLADFIKENHVDIALLCLPKSYAIETARMLVRYGIKAIWNFAHIDLELYLPSDVLVENVHLSESIMRLSCKMARKDESERPDAENE